MISIELSVVIIVLFFLDLLWSSWVCWEAEGLNLKRKGVLHIFLA